MRFHVAASCLVLGVGSSHAASEDLDFVAALQVTTFVNAANRTSPDYRAGFPMLAAQRLTSGFTANRIHSTREAGRDAGILSSNWRGAGAMQTDADHSFDLDLTGPGHEVNFTALESSVSDLAVPSLTSVMGGEPGVQGKTLGQYRTLMYAVAPILLAAAGVFEYLHTRWFIDDSTVPIFTQFQQEDHQMRLVGVLSGVRGLLAPLFSGWQSRKRWVCLAIIVGLSWFAHALSLLMMLWSQEFFNSVQMRNGSRFGELIAFFFVVCFTSTLVSVYQGYILGLYMVHLRKVMTYWLMDRWFSHQCFYRLQVALEDRVDNPDQRIQEDVLQFLEAFHELLLGAIKAVTKLCTSLPILLVLSPTHLAGFYCPGWMAWLAVIFAIAGTSMAHVVGMSLIFVQFLQQKYEANYRHSVVQVRDHAEAIALFGSEDVEKILLANRFQGIVRTWYVLLQYQRRLSVFSIIYKQVSTSLPMLLLAPAYFSGEATLGNMMVIFQTFNQLKGSLEWVITRYADITQFRATTDRLTNFVREMERIEQMSTVAKLTKAPPATPRAALAAVGVSVSLPNTNKGGSDEKGRVLWERAGLVVHPSEFVLLSAPEGSGKSCFFCALAGIWPNSEGDVFLPKGTFFLPQKSYIPLGTLKQAVCYPDQASRFTDEEARAALDAVALEVVKGKALHEEANWDIMLSGGERQQLAMARVVLRRPPVLLMDEATSSISAAGTLQLFDLLRRPGVLPAETAVITISHDVKLLKARHDTHYGYDAAKACWKKL